MSLTRSGKRVGWVVSVLLHGLVGMAFVRWGGPSMTSGTVARLARGGGSLQVDLLESIGPSAGPPPAVPRSIRKYEETPPTPPPRPDDLPEPPEKPSRKPSPERPTAAPNVRAPKTDRPTAPAPPVSPGPSTGTAVQMGIGSGSGPGGEEGTPGIPFPYQDYIQAVKWRIRTNWRPLVPPRGESVVYQARVFFTLNRAGQVIEFRLLESSGDPQYDMSVERAIRLAAPFPSLPPAYAGTTLSFDIVFRYKP